MNFYKRHLGDYSKDTPHLPMIEHGAYGLLLDYYYATEKPLPADMTAIFRVCRAISKAEQQAVCSVVEQFFPLGEDGLRHNKRADAEIAKAGSQRDINREIGKKGGRPKGTGRKTESVTEEITESVSEPQPNDNPSQTPDSRELPPTPFADATGTEAPNGHDSIELVGKAKREKRPVKRLMPEGWTPSDTTLAWVNRFLAEHGLNEQWAQRQHELFMAKATARGWMYVDWYRGYEGFFRENGPGGRYAA